MKTVWIASLAIAASTSALAQSTIYKHVDDSGRTTYTNRPMKGAVAMELEPLTTIPGTPAGMLQPQPKAVAEKASPVSDKAELAGKVETVSATASRPAVAIVTPVSQRTSIASIEPNVQRRRDDERRKILEEELSREEDSLTGARSALVQEQQNPTLVAAVRAVHDGGDERAFRLHG